MNKACAHFRNFVLCFLVLATTGLKAQELFLKSGVSFSNINLDYKLSNGRTVTQYSMALPNPFVSAALDYQVSNKLFFTTEFTYFVGGGISSNEEITSSSALIPSINPSQIQIRYLGMSQLFRFNLLTKERFELEYKLGPRIDLMVMNINSPSHPLFFFSNALNSLNTSGYGLNGCFSMKFKLDNLQIISELTNAFRLNNTIETLDGQSLPNNIVKISGSEHQLFVTVGVGIYLGKNKS